MMKRKSRRRRRSKRHYRRGGKIDRKNHLVYYHVPKKVKMALNPKYAERLFLDSYVNDKLVDYTKL